MFKRLLLSTFLVSTAILFTTASHALEFGQPVKATVLTTKSNVHSTATAQGKKDVYLLNIKLSEEERRGLFSFIPKKTHGYRGLHTLPAAINLGMNNVPVLDQGYHGACVTFANTAAVDAALGKGDYLSQLCQLELGSYLENTTYLISGWEGSTGPWVLDQMLRYGGVSKDNQKIKSCSGEREYPLHDFFEGNPMPAEEYKSMSEDLHDTIYPVYLLNMFQRFHTRFSDTDQVERALIQTKEALADGNRLTMGVFVIVSDYCSAGACASYRAKEDTWALTKELETPPYSTAGHEMVIMGYDDNAVATDQEGIRHQGLLILRNSWGTEAGDQGNYYMSYDYFKKFVTELQVIGVEKRKA